MHIRGTMGHLGKRDLEEVYYRTGVVRCDFKSGGLEPMLILCTPSENDQDPVTELLPPCLSDNI